MPCDDCREFRREMYELKEFVAKWFSVLLKRFDCQDRKLISLTEAICGEDICDMMGDVNTTKVQSNLRNNTPGCPKIDHRKIVKESSYDDETSIKTSNQMNGDNFKIDNANIPLTDFTNDSFLNYNEPCDSPVITVEESQPIAINNHFRTKKRKFSKPNRMPFPLVEFKERTAKAPEKCSTGQIVKLEEDEEFEEVEDEGVDEDVNSDEDDINPDVPSTSSEYLEELHEGQRFDSMKDFMFALSKYEERRCINLIVADSKKVETANKRVKPGSLSWDTKFKYCYFELRCSRAGIGEQCPFRLLVINSKTERRLVITKMVDSHHQLCAQNGNDEACRLRLLKRLL